MRGFRIRQDVIYPDRYFPGGQEGGNRMKALDILLTILLWTVGVPIYIIAKILWGVLYPLRICGRALSVFRQ
jgi:hypothetical protein